MIIIIRGFPSHYPRCSKCPRHWRGLQGQLLRRWRWGSCPRRFSLIFLGFSTQHQLVTVLFLFLLLSSYNVYLAFYQWWCLSFVDLLDSFRNFNHQFLLRRAILSLTAPSLLPFSALALLSCAPCLCPWPCPCLSGLCPRHNQCPDRSWSYFILFCFISFYFCFSL